ncbi:MAG TPA: ABC transporter ATP-binding protein [Candidatus Limnocylindria bacterium]|nr:ABC transporter ATP-binding protein [Candidatus Limnocylindria bacterium]
MPEPVLAVADLHTYYGDSHVLQGVSLGVAPGEIVALLGRNGMGKTTLIRSIVGFTPPRRGRVSFRGDDITAWPPFRRIARGMALVPQGRRIFASLSVRENLDVARAGQGRWNLARVYELFPRLRERAANRANKLSGGEQQMLAIGRSLMSNPDLLLMDEPTEGLAPLLVAQVAQAIGELKRAGLSILLVEQNLPMAAAVADRVHVLNRGAIVYSGTPAALLADEDVMSRYLGVA